MNNYCIRCKTLIYDISKLYGEKFIGNFYCTKCNGYTTIKPFIQKGYKGFIPYNRSVKNKEYI